MKTWIMLAAILLCLFIGGAPFAVAQDGGGDEFTLEEITVTAQKRAENQQKVPIAMEVITGEDLTAMGNNDIDEILLNIANVEIASASTGTRINIRGLVDDAGTFGDQVNVQSSMVATNVDGAFTTRPAAGNGLFDIERVEVLMGPQSTMYGANSPGGIVNIVTAAPKTDKWSANASVEYGSYDLFNLQGALNVPVIQDTFAMRVAANYTEQGTWVEGDPKSDDTAVRLKALWNVYEDLDVTVTGNWSKKSSGGMRGGRVKPFINQGDDTYPDGEPLTDPWTLNSDTSELSGYFDENTKGLSGEINWSFPFATLSLVPSYTKSDASGWRTDNSGEDYYQVRESEQTAHEVRMTNPASFELFQWIAGYTYSKYDQTSVTDYANDLSDGGGSVHQEKSAFYGNITYPLPFYDSLRVTAGYRQSWDEAYGIEIKKGEASPTGNPDTISKPNTKFGLEYDVNENMMAYASYASSYRSSSARRRMVTYKDGHKDFPPNENLHAYTMGLKSRWLDNRLQANLNVYYYNFDNKYAVSDHMTWVTEDELYPSAANGFTPGVDGVTPVEPYLNRGNLVTYELSEDSENPDGLNPSPDTYDYDGDGDTTEPLQMYVNDPYPKGFGTFTSLGADLQTTWLITSKDRLDLSIAYLDSEWKDLVFMYYYSPQTEDTGFEDEYPDFRYNVSEWEYFNGEQPPNSPKWGVTASYKHTFTLGALGTLAPKIDMRYKSEYLMSGTWRDNQPTFIYATQEAYTIWNASAAFQHSSGKWSLNAYAKNLTNYAAKTQVYLTSSSAEMRLGDPRTYGVTFSYKFF